VDDEEPGSQTVKEYDIVVCGGTPGGIAAALAAARLGRSVALIEYHAHLGGMAASGLGKSDIEHRALIGGLFREFVERIRRYYVERYGADSENVRLCRDGYYYEPAVAERTFDAMIASQPSIDVHKSHVLQAVDMFENRPRWIEVRDRITGELRRVRGQVFIDATYEGDLYALAGAAYRLGREGRDEFGEPHAGVVYFDYETGEFLPGSSGAADPRLPAYTYRLCLTTDPANSHCVDRPPAGYDRAVYLPYLEDLAAGRLGPPRQFKDGWGYYPDHFNTLLRALSVTELPNGKVDANINPRPLAFPFAEENAGYVEADWTHRERIALRHRDLTLGLLYFLQHDPQVPCEHRTLADRYHWPRDEFADNVYFPFQLYVREARRLRGCTTLTEHDVTGEARRGCEKMGLAPSGNGENSGKSAVAKVPVPIFSQPRREDAGEGSDAVAVGEFPIDSFPCRKRQPGDTRVLEGYLGMLAHLTRPYPIPYRIMVPESLDGLIVPVAASTTHIAYSSIRMEPTWMALGQAAGTAAHLCLKRDCCPRNVPIPQLQEELTAQAQVLSIP
jgi:hypothetical protein